jgi:hypothetical protein
MKIKDIFNLDFNEKNEKMKKKFNLDFNQHFQFEK